MNFSPADYEKSSSDYQTNWRTLDDTLYRLCQENPGHATMTSVCAKLWIIGRTYASGIERMVSSPGTQGGSMLKVAEHLFSHASEIDKWFRELRGISEPLTPSALQIISSVHGRLVRLISPITWRDQATTSFVSKYMHFHNAMVPLYDNVAIKELARIGSGKTNLPVFAAPLDADAKYLWYAPRFFALYELVRQAGLRASVRHVDYYLLMRAYRRSTTVIAPA